jgi:hypothetical protein
MEMAIWLALSYVVGSVVSYVVGFNRGTTRGIEETIDMLIERNYLKYERNADGEIDIKKVF